MQKRISNIKEVASKTVVQHQQRGRSGILPATRVFGQRMTVCSELVEHAEIVPHPTVVDERDELARRFIIRASAHQALEEHTDAPLPTTRSAYREPPPRPAGGESKAGSQATTASEKPARAVRGRSPPRPEDECSAKQPRVDDPTLPDPRGAQSPAAGIRLPPTPVATSWTSFDMPGAKTPVRPTRPKSSGPPLGSTMAVESPQTALPEENTCNW